MMQRSPSSPTSESLSDQAIEWLARLRAADVTDQERADFAAWLSTSDRHKLAFDETAALWHLLGDLPVSVESRPVKQTRYRPQWPLAAAASVLFACAVLVMQMVTPEYSTIKGEQRRIALQDGSTAYLNTDSHITVSFDEHNRRVVLHRGEVWFEVKKNPARPFIVAGAHASAQAVGTAFTVRETAGFTRISVTEGIVAVSPEAGGTGDVQYLRQGQRNTVSDQLSDVAQFDIDQALAWQHGQLIYRNVTLDELLSDLNRYLPANMTVNDEALLQTRVTTVLHLQDQEAMLDALAQGLPIRWKAVSDDLIIIAAR